MRITFGIIQFYIDNIAGSIIFRLHPWIQKSFIGCNSQLLIAFMDFLMQLEDDMNGILLNEHSCLFIISLAFYTLDFGQLTGKNISESLVIFHNHIMFTIMNFQ